MDAELKTKIKEVMIKHLTEKGYPNITNQRIMQELKPMWIKLEEAGLIQPGMNYSEYHHQAVFQYILSERNK